MDKEERRLGSELRVNHVTQVACSPLSKDNRTAHIIGLLFLVSGTKRRRSLSSASMLHGVIDDSRASQTWPRGAFEKKKKEYLDPDFTEGRQMLLLVQPDAGGATHLPTF